VSIDVLEIEFTNAQLGIVAYSRLGHLNNGGALNGQMSFYTEISGNDNTDYTNMFYGIGASNHGSYNGYSYVPVQNIIVALSDIELNVLKNENLADVSWNVINQKDNVINYEVEKSNNGIQFRKIGSVMPSPTHVYHFTDNLSSQSDGYVFYRIKEISANNNIKYSEIKSLQLSKLTYTTLYPIPCHDVLTIVTHADFDFNTSAKIFDESGKFINVIKDINDIGKYLDAKRNNKYIHNAKSIKEKECIYVNEKYFCLDNTKKLSEERMYEIKTSNKKYKEFN
jgi:hypothetical protein